MARKEYRTTEKDFKLFKKECERWLRLFGLSSWGVSFVHMTEEGNLAECASHFSARHAVLGLGKVWPTPATHDEIVRCAVHEVLELLLAPIQYLGESREWKSAEFDKERHAVIRRLEKVLLNRRVG